MNKSVMKCCICNNENIGRFITINNKKYHLCCIEQLQQENQELKKQLHDASIQIQELIEQDIECPSNCEKLEKLQQENKQLKDNWNKLKEYTQEKYDNPSWASCGARYVLEKMQELEQGKDE